MAQVIGKGKHGCSKWERCKIKGQGSRHLVSFNTTPDVYAYLAALVAAGTWEPVIGEALTSSPQRSLQAITVRRFSENPLLLCVLKFSPV